MATTASFHADIADHLLVDLYELTMVQAYLEADMLEPASFELFVRRLPKTRNFLVAAGLEQALAFLEQFQLTEAELRQIIDVYPLSAKALKTLRRLRFSGDVDAVPEGTVVFADE